MVHYVPSLLLLLPLSSDPLGDNEEHERYKSEEQFCEDSLEQRPPNDVVLHGVELVYGSLGAEQNTMRTLKLRIAAGRTTRSMHATSSSEVKRRIAASRTCWAISSVFLRIAAFNYPIIQLKGGCFESSGGFITRPLDNKALPTTHMKTQGLDSRPGTLAYTSYALGLAHAIRSMKAIAGLSACRLRLVYLMGTHRRSLTCPDTVR